MKSVITDTFIPKYFEIREFAIELPFRKLKICQWNGWRTARYKIYSLYRSGLSLRDFRIE